MTPASLQEVIRLAEICGFSRRMPAQASRLVAAAAELKEHDKQQLRAYMVERGITERMARRAIQVTPCCPISAVRIIDSMISLLGRTAAISTLRSVGYDSQISAYVRKFESQKNRRFAEARELCEHLRSIFGDSFELRLLADKINQVSQTVTTAA